MSIGQFVQLKPTLDLLMLQPEKIRIKRDSLVLYFKNEDEATDAYEQIMEIWYMKSVCICCFGGYLNAVEIRT